MTGFRFGWFIVLGAVVFLWVIASVAKGIYTEWLWFDSLGFSSIYTTLLTTKVWLFFAGALVFFAVSMGNITLAKRLSPKVGNIFFSDGLAPFRRLIDAGILAGGILFSLIFGSIASGQWDTVLRFMHRASFGTSDPIFGRDVAFFVFTLPTYRFFQAWALGGLVVTLLAVASIYLVGSGNFSFAPRVKAHLSALGAAIFALIAWSYRLDIFELVFSRRGVVFGASYTDIHAQWFALWLLVALVSLCAVLLLANIFRRGFWLPLLGVGLWLVAAIVVGGIYPGLVQKFQVEPNELALETPYIESNIRFTREAFGLDRIRDEDFPVEPSPSQQDIATNADTVKNIRLWDYRPLKDTYNQLQTIRLYYDFKDIDIDRYTIDGDYRQVMLGARELSPEKLASQAQTWVNQRLQFTHGYGLALNPVNEISEEGLPVFWVKDVPPIGKIKVDRPEIYYGEKTSNYVFVNTRAEEFDYPKGDANVYARYQGEGGVKLSSPLRRLAYAWEFGDINILLNSDLTPESKVLYYRWVQERVRHIAPFLLLDHDPYLVVADGKLVWIQDAYTITNRYPYSEPAPQGFNYIRNSVKVAINAYDGMVTFYLVDPTDAIAKTYSQIFPALFTPIEQMPASLRAHLRYPEDLFKTQAWMYLTYHMRDPNVFYNREDLWQFPVETYVGAEQPLEAYYVIMRLSGEAKEEFLLMLPFTPTHKDNMIAWMAARNDGDKYGELLAYKFPKDKLVYGPRQIEARIDQDPTISSQLTLWGQKGSQVIRGNLLVIPIGKSVLYVEPIYLRAEKGQLPELKRVVVASGNRVAMEPTLAESLNRIFGTPPTVAAVTPPSVGTQAVPSDAAALAQSAQKHYLKAQEYLKAGDWAGYGDELKKMGEDLERLAKLTAR